jgi:hypothetical protein
LRVEKMLAITLTYIGPYARTIRFEKCLEFFVKKLGIVTREYEAFISKQDTERDGISSL